MKIYSFKDLSTAEVENLCLRQLEDDQSIEERVKTIIGQVKTSGDQALMEYALAFDKVQLDSLYLGKEEIKAIAATIPAEAKAAIDTGL